MGAVDGRTREANRINREHDSMSATRQRRSRASRELAGVRGLGQAQRGRPKLPRRVRRASARATGADVRLPALVERVQSYLEVART
jgi:hypothetical protein